MFTTIYKQPIASILAVNLYPEENESKFLRNVLVTMHRTIAL